MAAYPQSVAYTRVFYAYLASDHVSPATGKTITMNVSKAGAAFGAAGGTITEIANGAYKIVLTTTDTNTIGDLTFYGTAAATDDIKFTDQVTDPIRGLGAPTALPGVAAGAANGLPINGTNLGSPAFATTSWGGLTSSQISTYAGGDTAGTTTLLGRVTGSVMLASSYTAPDNASIATILTRADVATSTRMATFTLPTNFSSLAITGGGAVTAGTVSDKTGYALTQTFPANFSALGITAGGKISGVVLADTLTTYTGNTPQTGDVFATANAEPTSVPASNASLADKTAWLFTLSRNKITQSATQMLLRNNADGATIGTSATSDDGTTAIRDKFA